ncbi:MAG TPA: hypothetical protein PKE05_10180 [Microthrixaceae bacterium]|nr:hypothetical protein [Microthrixaceae bacterium]
MQHVQLARSADQQHRGSGRHVRDERSDHISRRRAMQQVDVVEYEDERFDAATYRPAERSSETDHVQVRSAANGADVAAIEVGDRAQCCHQGSQQHRWTVVLRLDVEPGNWASVLGDEGGRMRGLAVPRRCDDDTDANRR